jgi:hypothetical protein
MVFCPVAFVQMLQPLAWKLVAVMMEPVLDLVTGGEGAVSGAFPVRHITAPAPVLFPQECHADGAVHAAGCDERAPEWILWHHTRDYVPGVQKSCSPITFTIPIASAYMGAVATMMIAGNRK